MVVAVPSYSRRAFHPATAQQIVAWTVEHIRKNNIQAVAASGLSGVVIAGAIGFAANVPVFAVRNGKENPHTTREVSGVAPSGPVERWAFVDDLIESGDTLDRTRRSVVHHSLTTSDVPNLILLYGDFNVSEPRAVGGVIVPQLVFGA